MNAPDTTDMPGAVLIICCVAGTCQLTVGIAVLDDEATQVKRVKHLLLCLLNGHTLVLAQLKQQVCIEILLGVVLRVNDCGL